jgi:CheY-like chemotaxis protein
MFNVLWIEDSSSDVLLLKIAASEIGSNLVFETISNGGEAMDTLSSLGSEDDELPQLVLLDLNLPQAHGEEILGLMKQHPALRAIPAVVLTTSDAPRDRERCLTIGCAEYIVKPVNFDGYMDLARHLERYLARQG